MMDFLTAEELIRLKQIHEPNNKPFDNGDGRTLYGLDLSKIINTFEALQAQNKRLVEALEGIRPFAEACKSHEFNGKYPGKAVYGFNGVNLTFDTLNQVLEALSTLPTEALEAERRREEVIMAAKAWNAIASEFPESPEYWGLYLEALSDKVANLEALEGGD